MTQQFKEWGWTEKNIDSFINKVAEALPHLPGNWDFISEEQKLRFIYNNKVEIYNLIEKYAPAPAYNSGDAFENAMAAFNDDSDARRKYQEYAGIRTTLVSLSID